MTDLTLVGFHLEDGGRTGVVVDASGTEHEASSPDELWQAIMAISSDPAIPRAEYNGEGYDDREAEGNDMQNFAVDAVEGIVGDAAGPAFGRLAGAFVRNGGPIHLLRMISRRNRGTG